VSECYRFILLFWTPVLEQSCTYTYTQTAAYFRMISRPVKSDGSSSFLTRLCILVKSVCPLRNACPRISDFREILSLKSLLKSVQKNEICYSRTKMNT